MSSSNFTAHLSNVINGVLFSVQGQEQIRVKFIKSLDFFEWQEFSDTLNGMIRNNYRRWEFNLEHLKRPTSIDIGMWLTCNAKIQNQSGSLKFVVKKESSVQKVLAVTKLDSILSIEYT